MPAPKSRLIAFVLLLAALAVPGKQATAANGYSYLTMSDGVKIAISVVNANPSGPKPVLFHMDGYGGGGNTWSEFNANFAVVHASIRGTGCSGGRFDLFDRRHALDGYEIITWLNRGLEANGLRPAQPKPSWSNGRIGIFGHSYPGLTGWLVASTQPPGLQAIAVSGLIDDLYRGIAYPGGVPNDGFPVFWTSAFRPAGETSGNSNRYQKADPVCAENIAKRPPRSALDDPLLRLTQPEDDTWYRIRSNDFYVDKITAPVHLITQYQDEQTGPRGAHTLYERIPDGVPKKLIVTNGNHLTFWVGQPSRIRWFNCYLRDICTGDVLDPAQRVQVYFDQQHPINAQRAPYGSTDWPLPETEWTRYHLCADGSLATETHAACDGTRSYLSAPAGRQTTEQLGFLDPQYPDGDEGIGRAAFAGGVPDELSWQVRFDTQTVIAGPINLTLHADSTAVNTDFFVDVLDVDLATGAVSYLQRGVQRASHRATDLHRSDCVDAANARVACDDPAARHLYRAFHPHTNTTTPEALLTPGRAERFEIEVFPVGHVFRPGHALQIRLHAPPAKDPISSWAWTSGLPAAVNTVHHSALQPSSILIPVVPNVPAAYLAATPPACGTLFAVPCFTPVR